MKQELQGIGMTSQRTRERLITKLREMGIQSEKILNLIKNTPRHIFVDEALASRAYENTALPIGYNQTISQPYIVARMLEVLANNQSLKNVLEIGTGCGYQTAILAQIAAQVFSIERIEELLNKARERMFTLRYRNVRLLYGDGNNGWPKYAPFDGIIVSAAPVGIPDSLLQQLSPEGGRMVIPVGNSNQQKLVLIIRQDDNFQQEDLDLVSFVPMIEGKG